MKGLEFALVVVRFAKPYIVKWLRSEVAKTESPIDDAIAEMVISALEKL